MTKRLGVLGTACAMAALAGACGDGAQEGTTSSSVAPAEVAPPPSTAPAAPASPATPAARKSPLPAVVVNDVASGTKVDLSTVPPADKPLLVWFWAPH